MSDTRRINIKPKYDELVLPNGRLLLMLSHGRLLARLLCGGRAVLFAAMAMSPLEKLRAVCLALPEAHEAEAWGSPTFRVKNKLFAMYAAPENHHGAGRHGVWLHCAPENQRALVAMDPERYFVPPYVGKSGWVGVWIDKRPRWSDIEPLIRDAYRRVAPKGLAALVR